MKRNAIARAVRNTLMVAALATMAVPGSASAQVPTGAIEGAWAAVEYTLASGQVHALRGRIFFQEGNWQVLFFVLDESGTPRRGSGEGGTFEVDGDRLTFHHELNLSSGDAMPGLPEVPLRMTAVPGAEAAAEAARFEIDGHRLTVFFPSGNVIRFERRPAR